MANVSTIASPVAGLVVAGDLLGRERARDRHGTAEVVRVGGAETGNLPARLRPGGRERRVGVDDPGHLRERSVEDEVGRRVRRRPERSVDDRAALQVDDDDRFGT